MYSRKDSRKLSSYTYIVPVHKGEDIGRGLLQEIIKDTKLTKEEFLKYLD
jgi:predicted RNA binding protein YcfA (HicA-like mRNA interferase family)